MPTAKSFRVSPPICIAVREAIHASDLTQEEIGGKLGVPQQTVSGWTLAREPRLDDLQRLEEVLGLQRGLLVRSAGYVAEVVTTRDAIAADVDLTPMYQDWLLVVYDATLRLAKVGAGETRRAAGRQRV